MWTNRKKKLNKILQVVKEKELMVTKWILKLTGLFLIIDNLTTIFNKWHLEHFNQFLNQEFIYGITLYGLALVLQYLEEAL